MLNISKAHIYNAVSAMALKAMNEINDINIEENRDKYFEKLGEVNVLNRLKYFIADYPTEVEEEKDDTRT